MLVRISDRRKTNTIEDFGFCSIGNQTVNLIEFTYRKGTEIYGEKEPAEHVYQVIRGAVRSYKLLSDGRRQIGAFHLIGDIFGLDNRNHHRFTTEAVVETTVRLIKRESLEAGQRDQDATPVSRYTAIRLAGAPALENQRETTACWKHYPKSGAKHLGAISRPDNVGREHHTYPSFSDLGFASPEATTRSRGDTSAATVS